MNILHPPFLPNFFIYSIHIINSKSPSHWPPQSYQPAPTSPAPTNSARFSYDWWAWVSSTWARATWTAAALASHSTPGIPRDTPSQIPPWASPHRPHWPPRGSTPAAAPSASSSSRRPGRFPAGSTLLRSGWEWRCSARRGSCPSGSVSCSSRRSRTGFRGGPSRWTGAGITMRRLERGR